MSGGGTGPRERFPSSAFLGGVFERIFLRGVWRERRAGGGVHLGEVEQLLLGELEVA